MFGIIDSLNQGASALVRVAAGFTADRSGRYKDVAVAGYALSALSRIGLLAAGGVPAFLSFAVLVDRIGKGIRTGPRDALISLSARREALGAAFGVHRAMDTAGAMIGPLLAFGLLALIPGGYDAVFVVSLCFGILGVGVIVAFAENRTRSDEDRELPASAVPAAPVTLRAAARLVAVPEFRRLLVVGSLLALVTVSDAFVYLAMQRRVDFDPVLVPLLFVGSAAAYMTLAVPAGRLADRFARVRLPGLPSRVRVSPDGRYGAVTAFVSGHSYAQGTFSTQTVIIDLAHPKDIVDVERFRMRNGDKRMDSSDLNVWGVTFAARGGRFYATAKAQREDPPDRGRRREPHGAHAARQRRVPLAVARRHAPRLHEARRVDRGRLAAARPRPRHAARDGAVGVTSTIRSSGSTIAASCTPTTATSGSRRPTAAAGRGASSRMPSRRPSCAAERFGAPRRGHAVQMTERLQDTVALVTGASSGIGEATARLLAAQGASVVVAARRKDRLDKLVREITDQGGSALALEVDVTDQQQAIAMVQRAIDRYERLDTVVNNAGVMLLGPVVDAPVEEWDRMIALNLQGLLYVAHAALPHLLAAADDEPRHVADLVNISSVAGRVARAGASVYNLTKFGVGAFSEALRQEVAGRHVRVSIVEPGAVATELTDHLRDEVKESLKGRLGSIEHMQASDIADAIAFIVTRPRHVAINELLIRPTEQEG